ncbi:UDP-N-acetylmuramate dehydrogenase [Haematospirillum sp. H1815]|nr:UDP-N-acetylmuramate dehydrogenase [Haematospirillum sp. H1815]
MTESARTMTRTAGTHLLERLRPLMDGVRGQLRADYDLSRVTWFQVGGLADIVFKPEDDADLAHFLSVLPDDVPVTVIGVGSNLLVRDGGIPGVTIRLGRGFSAVVSSEEHILKAGAAALDVHVARFAATQGLSGLEFLSGIPGTLGGALRMNAGAYGCEMADILLSATAIDRSGHSHTLDREAMGLSYRHCAVPDTWIFTHATLRGTPGSSQAIQSRMDEIAQSREDTQPVRTRTGGSTFANPDGHKAWELIDRAGCRGLRHGGAQVSEKHCNFLINTGSATARDLEELGDIVRHKVWTRFGVELRWEIRRIGVEKRTPAGDRS